MFYWTLELEVPENSLNLPNKVIMNSQKTKQISLLVALFLMKCVMGIVRATYLFLNAILFFPEN